MSTHDIIFFWRNIEECQIPLYELRHEMISCALPLQLICVLFSHMQKAGFAMTRLIFSAMVEMDCINM